MGRAPCCDKTNVKRGPWSPEEDGILKNFVETYGTGGNWIALPQKAGLKRCGKSCRLRWLNYLRPNIKHGGFTEEEDNIILSLYHSIGSRWSVIASQLPGRTDNDVKNYWNTKLKKKLFAAASGTSCPSTSIPAFKSSTNNFSLGPQSNNLNFSTGAGVHNMLLPYFPVEEISHQQMLAAPIPLPELMEIPENAHNSGVLFPAQEAAVSSLSPSYSFDNSFSSGSGSRTSTNGSVESDAFLAGLMQHDLTNAFDFQERYPGLLSQLYPHSSTAYPPYSTFLANVCDSEQLNPFHQSLT